MITAGASTDPGVTALFARIKDGGERALEMRMMSGSAALPGQGVTARYVACGSGQQRGDFPEAVTGQVALIRRGGNTFKEKAKLAEAAGAIAALIYNNLPGNFFGTLGDQTDKDPHPSIPVASISMEDGEHLVGLPAGQDGVSAATLFLDSKPVPQPDRLAEFSSRGPTRDVRIKPDLCAPGVDIDSATILPDMAPPVPGIGNMADPSGYASTSGTSMATPHIAGAVALLRQAHPEWDPFVVRAALMNNARYMPEQGEVMAQGAGRLDLERAVTAPAVLVTAGEPPAASHSFGVVEHEGKKVEVTQRFRVIELRGEKLAEAKVRVRWLRRAPGLRAYRSVTWVDVPAGCHAAFDLRLNINGASVPDGLYSGYLEVGLGSRVLRLPFAVGTKGSGPSVPPPPGPALPPGERGGGPGLPPPLPRPSARGTR